MRTHSYTYILVQPIYLSLCRFEEIEAKLLKTKNALIRGNTATNRERTKTRCAFELEIINRTGRVYTPKRQLNCSTSVYMKYKKKLVEWYTYALIDHLCRNLYTQACVEQGQSSNHFINFKLLIPCYAVLLHCFKRHPLSLSLVAAIIQLH